MAIFSGKVNTAHYIDLEYTLVEILYTGDDGNVYSHALRADPDNAEWKELIAEGWDEEKLLDGTAEYKRQHSAAFNTEVNAAARKLAHEMVGMKVLLEEKEKLEKEVESKKTTLLSLDQTVKIKTNAVDHEVFEYIMNNNSDKETLFKFKLWALEKANELDYSKEIKTKIRKCETILDGLLIFNELLSSI
jgi:hypothetical protein